jgi:hypothetical protein
VSRTAVDPAYILEQYEQLRRTATQPGNLDAPGHGLALLLSRGLPAWVAALATLTPGPRPRLSGRPVPPDDPPRWDSAVRMELTTVLAGIVLACAGSTEV